MFLNSPSPYKLWQDTNIILKAILGSVITILQYYQEHQLMGETCQKLLLGMQTGNESDHCKARIRGHRREQSNESLLQNCCEIHYLFSACFSVVLHIYNHGDGL